MAFSGQNSFLMKSTIFQKRLARLKASPKSWLSCKMAEKSYPLSVFTPLKLILLHSEKPKLRWVLPNLNAIG